MSPRIDTVSLRAKLREYDQTLPRCQKRIVRVSNHAPDYVSEEERPEWEMRLSYPCSDLEGHEGQCREGRAVLGWPGFATLTALLDEVDELRANHNLAAERLAALLDAERENTALRELLDAKSHETGLYARRMEQAQRSRDGARAEERAAVVAWLRACANAPHPIERGVPWLSPAGRGLLLRHADAIECGEHLIDNMHAHSEGLAEGERREHRREED